MLLNFRVANHRSIREEQGLQLHPVYEADRPTGTGWEAVPVAGIFGANAAGKSNLVDALDYMARMVVDSHRDAEPDGGVLRQPFRLDDTARDEPSWYVVDLLLREVRYTYGFSVDDEQVIDEWLYSYPRGKKRKIFERSTDDVDPGDSQPKRELKLVESITEPNVLFMSMAARSKQADFRPVYDWFSRKLQFRRLRGPMPTGLGTTRMLEAPERYPELMQLLRAADLGIEECGAEQVLLDEEELRRRHGGRIPSRLLAQLEEEGPREVVRPWIGHRGRTGVVQMELREQSAGTRALLEQAPRFISTLRRGGTFVVDEIDSSLHPLLTAQLIGLFQNQSTNPNGAQLIFTTHDASLLGRMGGEDILKRDQVWFVEKNQYGETELLALSEFKPRQDENRERRYLGGSYGGVPFIDDSFAKALATRGDPDGGSRSRPQEWILNTSPAEILSVALLVLVLACAVIRPFGRPEAVVAVPAAAVVIGAGAIPLADARAEAARLGPVIGFLAAVLVLAQLCDEEGLFDACGAWMARTAAGRPRRLLVQVFVTASVITAVLSLDATVVLLTPVVFATAARIGARPKPHVYACTHLSNTASLLLPVSNLTNLLAFAASGLSFTRFAALMALPWLVAIATEYAVFRRFFATDLDAGAQAPPAAGAPGLPVFALATVVGTLAGFVLTSALGIDPAWAALAGAAVLAVRALAHRRTTPAAIVRAASVPFLAFVLALGIVVQAVVDNGLDAALGRLVPDGTSLAALLGLAALAAVLANLINNLPAVLVLLPLTAPSGPGAVLAVLVGVNIGPNLTYAGSLATLLWRRIVHAHDGEVELREFTRLGLLAVPASLFLAVLALWASLTVLGGG